MGEMTGGVTGGMKIAKVLYIKGSALSDGRDGHFFSRKSLLKRIKIIGSNFSHALGTCDAFLRSVGAQALRGGLAKNYI